MGYAWDNNLRPIFPFLNETDANKSYNRDKIFFRIDASPCPRSIKKIHKNYTLTYKPIPPYKDVFLDGPFFCWRYFHHHRDKILAAFAPSKQVLDYLYAKYGDLIGKSNTVGIHVRTTSRYIHDVAYPFPGLNYFALAIAEFPSDSIFVVCSDRINWCKKNFTEKFPGRTFVFIEGNDHIEDLFLLSMMKHNILSNLTYSWWTAYLNTNPGQIVYVPMRMVKEHLHWPIEEFYLPGWKVIPYDFLHDPYPEDMYLYDEKSQSLHEKND